MKQIEDMLILPKRIEALDKEIDARVYCLYGLKEEEVKIVERG